MTRGSGFMYYNQLMVWMCCFLLVLPAFAHIYLCFSYMFAFGSKLGLFIYIACIFEDVIIIKVFLPNVGRMIQFLFLLSYIRRSQMATGTALTALVGYVEIWSLTKTL